MSFTAITPSGRRITWTDGYVFGDPGLMLGVKELETYFVSERLDIGPITGPRLFPEITDPRVGYMLLSLVTMGIARWKGDVPYGVLGGVVEEPSDLNAPPTTVAT